MNPAQEFIDGFEPLADQVLVEPLRSLERFERKSGSLYLADNPERDKKREVFHLGRVVKCGPGDAVLEGPVRPDGTRAAYAAPDGRFPMHVKAGDIVLYERRPWAVIAKGDRQFVVLHEEQHIVAVVEGLDEANLSAVSFDPLLDRLVA